ncbi:amino acid adenylation domain-containing protein [Sulfitobacter albidus]|uniref:Amino acid adenylation domain-containing protein n=1 Tax=Sulfitobacter albidus TaxID=2829501 RepID=A0A975JEI2_9RHOB|nr:non-ribosomal peptide synthetase [Sulfitobacter albidus]QUJ76795.1 amino acid adenylation domain-containing protein [Sulfitobacter albidus]
MVHDILREAQAEGVQLYVEDDRLKFRARDAPPSAALSAQIKRNKEALIALLTAQRVPTLTPSGRDRAPLTPNQARVFYQGAAFDTGETYVMQVAYRFDALLDPARLRAAFERIVARHSVLRSRFFVDETGVPTQQICEEAARCLIWSVEADVEPAKWLHARAQARCDLSSGQVMNVALLQGADESHLHIACHHIAFDGASYGALFAELVQLYEEPEADLAPLPLHYVDFALSEVGQGWSPASRDYWRAQLDGVASFNGLPPDRPRPPVADFGGTALHQTLPADLEDGLSALAARVGVSRFTAYLAAFNVQLSRYLRTEDCVVGTPLSGRSLPQLDGMIGFFANFLPLRNRIDPALSFRQLLAQVHRTNLMAQQHQDLDVQEMIRDLGYAGETAFTPLNQIVFSFEESRDEHLILGGHRGQKLPLPRQRAAFDIECSLVKHADGPLEAYWVYSDALFDADTMSGFAEAFETTLRRLIAAPETALGKISLGPTATPAQALHAETPPPCFIEMFEAQVARSPQADACRWVEPDGTVVTQSYAALDARATAMAAALLRHGVTAGDCIAVCVGPLAQTIAHLIAVQKTGAAYMILDPAIPSDRSRMMYARAGCHCAIGTVVAGQLPPDATVIEAAPDDAPFVTVEGPREGAAVVLFTSGSTGTPKGVSLPHGALAHFLSVAQGRLGIGPRDCAAVASTLTFDAHILEIYLALSQGGSLALLDPARARDAAFLQRDQDALGISTLFATPTTWQILRDAGWRPRDGMTLITGGETLPQHLSDDLLTCAHDLRLLNVYGPTEATVFNLCAFMQPDVPVSLGVALPGNRVRLVDPYGHPVPPACRGEITIAGPQVGLGYLGPEPGFSDGPAGRCYATGDIARQAPDGQFSMIGREDFQVKIHGVRLELDEIATALEQHPCVIRATVVLSGADGTLARLAAYVETILDRKEAGAQLARFLAARVPRSHLPGSYTVLDRMPLTPSGKIDRNALPAPTAQTVLSQGRAPETALERTICAIWSTLLERPVTDTDTGFFELGGHSLLAIRMINQINRSCGTDLNMRDVVGALTVGDLAQRIGAAKRARVMDLPVIAQEPSLPAPLSFAQERIWTIDRIGNAGTSYTVPLIFEVTGAGFDRATAEAFLVALVAKHRVLACVYDAGDGTPVQDLGQQAPQLAYTDASTLAEAAADAARAQAERSCLDAPFDLRRGPVMRGHLVKLGADRHLWFLAFHHIAFDGASLALFVRELRSFLAHATLDAPPAPSYAAYARWQRETYDMADDLRYWKDRLEGAPVVHQIPLDHPRPPDQGFAGETIVQRLSVPLSQGLRAFASSVDSSEFATILALFAGYLQLLSGESDLVLGTPVANRQRPELENTMGCFINTLPLRMRLDTADSLSTLVARVQRDVQNDLSHDGVPFEKLVSALCPHRSFSHHPLFQIMVQLDNSDAHAFEASGVHFAALQPRETEAKFDLTLGIRPADDIALSWNFATDLFARATIERMMAEFVDWITACLADPSAPLPLLARKSAAATLCGPQRPAHPDTVAQRFTAMARTHPDRTVLCDGEVTLSYRQLETRARALCETFADLGIGPQMLVGVHLTRSADLVVAALACLLRDCVYLPLDPAYPVARTHRIIADARPALVICADGFGDVPAAQFDVTHARHQPAAADYDPREGVQDAAYVIYTSGSTGQPKGVQVGHASLSNFIDWMQTDLGLEAGARVLQVTSPSFDISITELIAPLAVGATVVIGPSMVDDGAVALVDLVAVQHINVLQMVPGMLQAFLDAAGGRTFSAVTRVYCGGESVPADLLRAARRSFPQARIFAVYGPTEATIWASAMDLADASTCGVMPLGQPAANTFLTVRDDRGRPVAPGQTGELHIGGAALALGYLDDPERTRAAFVTDADETTRLYRTGDLVRVAQDDSLHFIGRADTQIKLRGHRIELGEIETALRAAGATTAACVLTDDTLTAFVDAEAPERLRENLATRLPDYMMPARIVAHGPFPRTPNGKIDRRALSDAAHRIATLPDDAPPKARLRKRSPRSGRMCCAVARSGGTRTFLPSVDSRFWRFAS